jgi:acid phosphatase class B
MRSTTKAAASVALTIAFEFATAALSKNVPALKDTYDVLRLSSKLRVDLI